MKHKYDDYIDTLFEIIQSCLKIMTSSHTCIAVLVTAIFWVKMLQWVGIDQRIIDMIFIPCAIYFIWAFLISWIDLHIERDIL